METETQQNKYNSLIPISQIIFGEVFSPTPVFAEKKFEYEILNKIVSEKIPNLGIFFVILNK